MTESVQPTLRCQLHLLRCGSSRAGHRIRWICSNMTKQFLPNLERAANASLCYGVLALDSTCAGRQSATLLETSLRFGSAFLYHKNGHTTVARSAQPTLRWQLHLLRCGSSRAGYRIRWICNSMSNTSLSPSRVSRERTSVF